jgi:predicted TIM-barrel fold metal-dependent hydrolase
MLIVDGQVHVWAADTPQRPWPKRGPPQQPVPFGPEDLLREMDAAGVDRAILVPPIWEGERNDVALAAVERHPGRFRILGRLPIDGSAPTGAVAQLGKTAGVLGLRFTLFPPALREMFQAGRLDWLWAEAEKHDVAISLLVAHDMAPLVTRVVERHPGLRLTLDHLSLTGHDKGKAAFTHFDSFLKLARYPNVATKISAVPCFADDAYPFRAYQGYMRQAFEAFGPDRTFWGTDLTRSPISYRQNVTLFTEELAWLKGSDLEKVMGTALCAWLRWPV